MEERAKKSKSSNVIIDIGKEEVEQHLPPEILFDIFARLPLKPLIKLKTVCKLWFNIISDPNFVEFHLQQYWTSKLLIILAFSMEYDDFQFYSFNFKEMRIKPKITCLQNGQYYCFGKELYTFQEQTSCDGFTLFEGMPFNVDLQIYELKLCVYNFNIQSAKLLPSIPHLETLDCFYLLVHDASIQKYKVIVWYFTCPDELRCYVLTLDLDDDDINGANNAAASPTWRVLSQPFPLKMIPRFTDRVAVNGLVHWLAETNERRVNSRRVFIQTFDIAREVFDKRIETPCQPIRYPKGERYLKNFTLFAMNGSLCLMSLASNWEDELDVWVLKGAWILQHKITLSSITCKPVWLKSLAKHAFDPRFVMESCSSSHNYILVSHFSRGLFCFNLETQEIRQIAIESTDSGSWNIKELTRKRQQQFDVFYHII